MPPPIGLAAVEATGRIVKANPALERMIEAEDGLLAPGRVLAARRSFELARLRKFIQDAASEESGARGNMLLVGRPSGLRPYTVFVTPFARRASSSARAQPRLALVLVSDPGQYSVDLGARLAELYGLTPAEMRAALGLARGLTPKDIAADAGVGLPTVRTQVRLLMKKMDVRRHAEVVVSILELEALLRAVRSG